MSNIDYTNVADYGTFRALRLWHDPETNEWIVDAEALDGTINTQEWSYARMDQALTDMPLLHAVLVSGVQVYASEGQWLVMVPIPGGGKEGSLWPTKAGAETFLRSWVQS